MHARYSPETFAARLRNIASQLNPFMLLKSDGDVDAAKALLQRHDAGASSALGRPIPRALLAPYFDPRHFTDDRHLGVVSFDVFEAICVENFA